MIVLSLIGLFTIAYVFYKQKNAREFLGFIGFIYVFISIADSNSNNNATTPSFSIDTLTTLVNSISTASTPKIILILCIVLIYVLYYVSVLVKKYIDKQNAEDAAKAALDSTLKEATLQTTKDVAKNYYSTIDTAYTADITYYNVKLEAKDLAAIYLKIDPNLYDAFYEKYPVSNISEMVSPYTDVRTLVSMSGLTNQERAVMICKLTKVKKPLSVIIA